MYLGRLSEPEPGADRSLIGSAREELLLSTFWQAYLPNSSIFPLQAVGYASGGWTNVVQQLYRKDPVLYYTLMANCFSAAARHGESRSMAEQSLRAHGRALYELRLALDNPKKARSDGVFSALRLMIVFSVCTLCSLCSLYFRVCSLYLQPQRPRSLLTHSSRCSSPTDTKRTGGQERVAGKSTTPVCSRFFAHAVPQPMCPATATRCLWTVD